MSDNPVQPSNDVKATCLAVACEIVMSTQSSNAPASPIENATAIRRVFEILFTAVDPGDHAGGAKK